MDALRDAINFARDAKVSDFQSAIASELEDKIRDRLTMRKIELAGKIFNNNDDSEESEQQDNFRIDTEDNVDEDL